MKKLIKEYKEIIHNDLIPYMQKKFNFTDLPTINFVEDQENAKDIFGKTAHYNPSTQEITVFTTNRHPKDVMRSVAHEVIHHVQNCRGEFNNSLNLGEEGYAQNNKHLRNMEFEAYSDGNMTFRDFTDNYTQQRNLNNMSVTESKLRNFIRSTIKEMLGGDSMSDAAEAPVGDSQQGHEGQTCEELGHSRDTHAEYLKKMERHYLQGYQPEEPEMSLNEWRNIELNSLLLNRFGIVSPQVLGEKRFANDPKLDKDGDGKPKWADKNDNNPKVGKRKDRKVSDATVKKAHEIGKEVAKSGSADKPFAVGMAAEKKLAKKKGNKK